MDRFILRQSEFKPGFWVCTDTVNLINCTFEDHNFNDNQDFQLLNNFDPSKYMDLAKFSREMGDWLRANHYDKIF